MRKKTYPQKKMTFLSLLLRGLLVTAIICAAFAGALREYILYQIRTQAETQMNERLVKIQQQAGYIDTTSERQFVMNDLHYKITLYTGFDIYIPQLIADNDHSDAIQVTPYYSKNNHAICVLLDENNNIAASNSFTLRTVVRPNEDESESGLYTFDKDALDMPEVSKLFDDIEELLIGNSYINTENSSDNYYEMPLKERLKKRAKDELAKKITKCKKRKIMYPKDYNETKFIPVKVKKNYKVNKKNK